jgi:hypothetical protein
MAAAYSLVGTAVNRLGKETMVVLESGTNGSGGTVRVKLQESDDNTNFTDVTDGAFALVTAYDDNATYELAYTGTKPYLRAVATVAGNACEFGVSIITSDPTTVEDTLLQSLIETAREYCEGFQNRAFVTQTWEPRGWIHSHLGSILISRCRRCNQ